MNRFEHKPFIDVYQSVGGWKARLMVWDPSYPSMYVPEQTGLAGYDTQEEAIAEAKEWAKAENIEYAEVH
jgi:hypothetical protein